MKKGTHWCTTRYTQQKKIKKSYKLCKKKYGPKVCRCWYKKKPLSIYILVFEIKMNTYICIRIVQVSKLNCHVLKKLEQLEKAEQRSLCSVQQARFLNTNKIKHDPTTECHLTCSLGTHGWLCVFFFLITSNEWSRYMLDVPFEYMNFFKRISQRWNVFITFICKSHMWFLCKTEFLMK